ncbi:MAG: hypothetical protein K6B73_01330 [Treponema sp.]|nr:hypothetical protein [Treponema sp.]
MKTTGFASPATEYEQERVDFNRALRPFPASEFEFRFKGHDMESHHIQDGDLLIIDRSRKPSDGCIAVVVFEGGFLCRQILFSKKWNCYVFLNGGRWERVTEIFGIATYNIHTLGGRRL